MFSENMHNHDKLKDKRNKIKIEIKSYTKLLVNLCSVCVV